jgi:hypothetical protein
MKRTAILFAALAGLLLTAPAQAQAPGKGYYMGLGVGTVWTDAGGIYNDTVNEDISAGGKIYGGYMWSDSWGMEVGLHSLGRYDVEFGGAKISDLKTTALSVTGVHTQPLFDWGYNINLRLGLAFTDAKYTCVSLCGTGTTPGLLNVSSKRRGVSGTFGLGVSAKLSEDFSLRVDFDHFGSVHHQVDLTEYRDAYDVLSASLQLQF